MNLLKSMICILLAVSMAVAEEKPAFPDLSKALKGGEIVHPQDNNFEDGVIFKFGKDTTFQAIKKRLQESLGEDWKEGWQNPIAQKAFERVHEKEGRHLLGSANFVSPDFPETGVRIMLFRILEDGVESVRVHLYPVKREIETS